MVASESPIRITGRIFAQGVVETTFGQDHHQRAEAERVRELGVLELQAEPGLAEQHAHQQVDEQAGQPHADRQPDRQDREQEHSGADQQNLVELMDVECHRRAPRRSGSKRRRTECQSSGRARHENVFSFRADSIADPSQMAVK